MPEAKRKAISCLPKKERSSFPSAFTPATGRTAVRKRKFRPVKLAAKELNPLGVQPARMVEQPGIATRLLTIDPQDIPFFV